MSTSALPHSPQRSSPDPTRFATAANTIVDCLERFDGQTSGMHFVVGRPASGKTSVLTNMFKRYTGLGYRSVYVTSDLQCVSPTLHMLENSERWLECPRSTRFTFAVSKDALLVCTSADAFWEVVHAHTLNNEFIIVDGVSLSSDVDRTAQELRTLRHSVHPANTVLVGLNLPMTLEEREDKRPRTSDVPEAVRAQADHAFSLYRDDVYYPTGSSDVETQQLW